MFMKINVFVFQHTLVSFLTQDSIWMGIIKQIGINLKINPTLKITS